uniref:Ion transport domain-containing protein n=1 Tax=Noctiluca scintillans TaxID=2966 RepID=A0A7S1F3C6_NOCSC|mmetsp:Transcript_30985/g.82333  ORF Transcript_30985/g.82333 Transcript_30985/m.82333 type:complete len:422 (+) Transcript_30985:72-1337(+)
MSSPGAALVVVDDGLSEDEEDSSEEAVYDAPTCSSLKHFVSNALSHPESSMQAEVVQYAIVALVFASIAVSVVQTIPEWHEHWHTFFWVEMALTTVFTLELAGRFWVRKSALDFFKSRFNIIDVIAVAPTFAEVAIVTVLRDEQYFSGAANFMRLLRMVRTFRLLSRLFRVLRFAETWAREPQLLLTFTMLSRLPDSGLYVLAILLVPMVVISSTFMYLAESSSCDPGSMGALLDSGVCAGTPTFGSIPEAFWFSIITWTTVGYGDSLPSTVVGKMVGGLTATGAVLTLPIVACLFSCHVRESLILVMQERERKAAIRFKEANPALSKQRAELEERVVEFQTSLDALTEGLTGHAVRLERPPFVLLTCMKEQADALSMEAYSCVYDAFLATMRDMPVRNFGQRSSVHALFSRKEHNNAAKL